MGEEVHAIEETFNSDGTVRLHITRPVEGKKTKQYEPLSLTSCHLLYIYPLSLVSYHFSVFCCLLCLVCCLLCLLYCRLSARLDQ